MVRFATVAVLAMTFSAFSPLAVAQSAPIQRGATSGDLAQQMADVRQQNAQLMVENSRLQQEIADANGKVETLEFLLSQTREEVNRMQEDDARIGSAIESLNTENERLTERVKALETDLSAVIAMLEAGDAPEGEAAGASDEGDADAQPERRVVTQSSASSDSGSNPQYQGSLGTLKASNLPGEAGPLFSAAKSKLLNFDFEGAEEAFRAFLVQFGDDPQAGEAQYWLAESLYQQDAYAESGQAYTQMIREYPDHARAPDALVKLARSMRIVGDLEKACNALDILPQQYPNASGVTRNLAALERTRAECDS